MRPSIDYVVGDCLSVLPGLPDGCFDVCVTSPPYNIGVNYRSGHDDRAERSDYLWWTARWLVEVHRVLSPGGSLFLNVGGKPTDPLVPHQVLNEAITSGKMVLQNTIFWIKSMSENGAPCEGHVKPINSSRFVNDAVEHVFHLTKRGDVVLDRLAVGVPYADESNLTRGTRGKNGNVRCRGNAWAIPYRTIQSRVKDRPHPASFPVELPEMCMRLHGVGRIRRTLDPFSGIGTTGRASARLGLDHVGIELSAEDSADAERFLSSEKGVEA